MAQIFVTMHWSVAQYSQKMLLELRRHNYVTPTNYLELVSGYKKYGNRETRRAGGCLSKVLIGENTQNVAKETGWRRWALRWDGRVTEGLSCSLAVNERRGVCGKPLLDLQSRPKAPVPPHTLSVLIYWDGSLYFPEFTIMFVIFPSLPLGSLRLAICMNTNI